MKHAHSGTSLVPRLYRKSPQKWGIKGVTHTHTLKLGVETHLQDNSTYRLEEMRRPAEMMILSTIVLLFGALLVEGTDSMQVQCYMLVQPCDDLCWQLVVGVRFTKVKGKGAAWRMCFSTSGQAMYRAVGLPKLRKF